MISGDHASIRLHAAFGRLAKLLTELLVEESRPPFPARSKALERLRADRRRAEMLLCAAVERLFKLLVFEAESKTSDFEALRRPSAVTELLAELLAALSAGAWRRFAFPTRSMARRRLHTAAA